MARWVLVRHAQSSPARGTADLDRTLTLAGAEAAARAGRWIADQGWAPTAIYCSPATRTRETYERASAAWPAAPAAEFLPALYDASDDDYLQLLKGEGTIMIVGHNPTIEDFVFRRAPEAPPMRPATVACFEDGLWVMSETG